MRILILLVIVGAAGSALFLLPDKQEPKGGEPGPEIRTPEVKERTEIGEQGSSEIKVHQPDNGPKVIIRPPTISLTPDELLNGGNKTDGVRKDGELKVYFPREMKPRNGILVIVPTSMNATGNPKYNPLLQEHAPTAVVRLWRIPENKEVLVNNIAPGNYDVLLYRNDGNKGRAPTRVGVYETSTGTAVDIKPADLEKIGLK